MNLPNLTQYALLDRGQANLLHQAVQLLHQELLHRDPTAGQRLSAVEALSLRPLTKTMLRLLTVAKRDDGPPPKKAKPHRFKMEYDELTAVRCFYARLLATAHQPEHHELLATALGRLHCKTLNVEGHIKLPAAIGPGCQFRLPV